MNTKYLASTAFSVSSIIWSIYGWYNDSYGAGLLVYALMYFLYEVYSCVKKSDYQYVVHGFSASAAIIVAFMYGPSHYKYIYNALSIFELSTPFLNIAKQYRTNLSYKMFAGTFFTSRILVVSTDYIGPIVDPPSLDKVVLVLQ